MVDSIDLNAEERSRYVLRQAAGEVVDIELDIHIGCGSPVVVLFNVRYEREREREEVTKSREEAGEARQREDV
jgi:hypothetical protein